MSKTPSPACPCGRLDAKRRPLPYADCCGRYLDSNTPAPDAESLMRSRYSAFVRERADYLLATWHPSQRPPSLDFEPGAKWLGLEVRRHRVTGPDTAEVEFVARHRVAGQAVRLHENSRFVRQGVGGVNDVGDVGDVNGVARWFYVDGDMLG